MLRVLKAISLGSGFFAIYMYILKKNLLELHKVGRTKVFFGKVQCMDWTFESSGQYHWFYYYSVMTLF